MEEITTTVEIIDEILGHDTLQLTKAETLSRVESGDSWIFAGDRMVQRAQLAEADWQTVGTVRIVPGLVGGR